MIESSGKGSGIPVSLVRMVESLNDEQFHDARMRYARESALADREGGDESSYHDYWDGWLDEMTRDQFAAELAGDDEDYVAMILFGSNHAS